MAYSVPLAGVALPWSDDGGELIYLAGKTVRQESEEVWDSRKIARSRSSRVCRFCGLACWLLLRPKVDAPGPVVEGACGMACGGAWCTSGGRAVVLSGSVRL